MRRLRVALVVVSLFALALTTPATAHHLIVDPPGGGNGTEHWVGGPPDEAPLPTTKGRGLHETPFGTFLPASHSAGPGDDKGQVQACLSTRDSNAVVTFVPPPPSPPFPPDTDCKHGEPLP
jgi:hypothetical protein